MTLLLSSVAFACGSPPSRAPNPTRPLDERRAVEIILQAFHDERDLPVHGHPVLLSPGRPLEVDVLSQGKKYGVAYVTSNERVALGPALPAREASMGDALQLVSGVGDESDARILVLHDTDYAYDDQVGEEHEETTVTAELKLRRDVRDFLVRAHAEKWP
ncbi:MAG TPA: hypothetical protein VGQ57_12445 [Polyangiaceae bacterium]|jgi:hypothetical protein|nr:hypothetical protein [Polyangiaceae bacterium]